MPDPVLLPAPAPLLPSVEAAVEPDRVSVLVAVVVLGVLVVSGVLAVVGVEDVTVVVLDVVVSVVVDAGVGEAAVVVVVVVVEPGVALAPELLYDVLPVLAPRLQPGRAAVASARTAT